MNPSTVDSLQVKNGFEKLHPLSKTALSLRGIGDSDLEQLIDFSLLKLQDPHHILGMEKAVERLFQAYQAQEKILIYGDYDLDGSSGVCLLKIALDQLGFEEVHVFQPDRHKEGYGVHASLMKRFSDQGISLILTVDVGITALEAGDECLKLGIDLIVTDHHLPKEKLPHACAIVNPNQQGDSSDLKFLCGAGVAFYLVRALKRRWSLEGLVHSQLDLKALLPFVVLSTVTDMVPLIKDNRILVRHGLEVIPKTSLKSWQELLKKFTYGKKRIQVSDVAISIAPKLNALTRMSGELTPVDFLLSEEPVLLRDRLEYLVQKNKEREGEQHLAQNIAQALADVRASHDPYLFVADPTMHLGVLGLVATKISQDVEIPVFIAGQNEEGLFVGSARLPEKVEGSLLDALNFCSSALIRFGGHSHAAGFMFSPEKIEDLRAMLKLYFSIQTLKEKAPSDLVVEARLDQFYDVDFLRDLDLLEPFGKGFEPFLFRVRHLRSIGIQVIKEKHLKLTLQDNSKRVTMCAWLFSATKAQTELLAKATDEGFSVDVQAHVQLNEFRGKLELQLLLKNLVRSAE